MPNISEDEPESLEPTYHSLADCDDVTDLEDVSPTDDARQYPVLASLTPALREFVEKDFKEYDIILDMVKKGYVNALDADEYAKLAMVHLKTLESRRRMALLPDRFIPPPQSPKKDEEPLDVTEANAPIDD